jgi:hypothetical protein
VGLGGWALSGIFLALVIKSRRDEILLEVKIEWNINPERVARLLCEKK